MKKTREITKKSLFIEELEQPLPALAATATTLAVGEEDAWGKVTTLAIGEESK